MEIVCRLHEKDKRGNVYHELYFITSEVVTILEDGQWYYEDPLVADSWTMGNWRKINSVPQKVVVSGSPKVPEVVKDALKDLGYNIVAEQN